MALNRPGFQSFVQAQPASGIAGDFAGAPLRQSKLAGSLGLIADATHPPIVGNFGFIDPLTGLVSSVYSAGNKVGFIHRVQGATVIVDFLGQNRNSVQAGFPVELFGRGDFWVFITAGGAAGAPIYADATTGAPTTTSGGNVATPFTLVTTIPADVTLTGVVDANGVLTASAVTGVLQGGQFLAGVGVGNNVQIVNQKLPLTGGEVVGGAGRYQLNSFVAVASVAMTSTQGKQGKISSWQV